MDLKFYRDTQEYKGFQTIPHKPSLDDNKFHRILRGRGSEPDRHGGHETQSKVCPTWVRVSGQVVSQK